MELLGVAFPILFASAALGALRYWTKRIDATQSQPRVLSDQSASATQVEEARAA